MNAIVLYPKCSSESALKLAKALKCEAVNPFDIGERDFTEYDLVINYGCNRKIAVNRVINRYQAVAKCVDKVKTFKVFNEHDIPTVEWVTEKENIPKHWKYIVLRKEGKELQIVGWTICTGISEKMLLFFPYTRNTSII